MQHLDKKDNIELKVLVPVELAEYAMMETRVCGKYLVKRSKGNSTHHLSKVLGLLLLLKAEAPGSSLIQKYTRQVPALSARFNISARTFFYHVATLEKMELVKRRPEGHLEIASWKQIGRKLQINTEERKEIIFNHNGKQKIHWWLTAIEIEKNQDKQRYMILKKVNKNSDVRTALMAAMIARGFDLARVDDAAYFIDWFFALDREDFISGTDVHHILIHIRSDVNRGVKKLSYAWCMSPQLVSYYKKMMRRQEVVEISKMSVTSSWTRNTKECHKRKGCHVIYDPEKKERVWFLCDQINLLKPWTGQDVLEQAEAA